MNIVAIQSLRAVNVLSLPRVLALVAPDSLILRIMKLIMKRHPVLLQMSMELVTTRHATILVCFERLLIFLLVVVMEIAGGPGASRR